MNRKKIILYGLVCAVAVGVLISDQLSGDPVPQPVPQPPHPNSEPAAPVTPAADKPVTTSPTPQAAQPPSASAQRRYVVRHLHDLFRIRRIDITQTPNAFAIPKPWREQPQTTSPAGQPVEKARPQFHLSALMVSPQGALAIINNKVVYMNQLIEGYRLVGIGERTAELSNGHDVISLKLKTPLPDGSGSSMNIGPSE